MNRIECNYRFNGIDIDVAFNKGVNILTGDSGTGKTLLLDAIECYCVSNNVKRTYLDYKDADKSNDDIVNYCAGTELILIDNSDLFVNNELISKISGDERIIIMSMHKDWAINVPGIKNYVAVYENKKLTVEEF